jgi:hypothetical protein
MKLMDEYHSIQREAVALSQYSAPTRGEQKANLARYNPNHGRLQHLIHLLTRHNPFDGREILIKQLSASPRLRATLTTART